MNYVIADGKSNWLEGMILVCGCRFSLMLAVVDVECVKGLYIVVAISFWFYPGAFFTFSIL